MRFGPNQDEQKWDLGQNETGQSVQGQIKIGNSERDQTVIGPYEICHFYIT